MAINDLKVFTKEETFILLNERASYIQKLIKDIKTIWDLPIELINELAKHGVDFLDLTRTYTELVFVLYRSMFVASAWEKQREEISEDAYFYDQIQKDLHRNIIEHVNKILAHQDNVNAGSRRGIYPRFTDSEGNVFDATWNSITHHAYELIPLIESMKSAIETAYLAKFNKALPLL
ncbi:MAG: hypothetical protein K2Q34_01120, partial [Alphaproteobacteria bacterium]|nr:hypothetical protein [Alphaproteobacteria bacterium]